MSRLRLRPSAPEADGKVLEVTPKSVGWRHVGFRLHWLTPGRSLSGFEPDRETCLVLVSGTADIRVGATSFAEVGGRASPFEDRAPGAVYVPAGQAFEVVARDAVELAVCSAPGQPGREPRRIEADDMSRETRGHATNTRHVRNILPQDQPADSLLVVEVITPGGHWSSYPPHKHDSSDGERETALEETYYFRVDPPQGFAVQRIYTDDRSLDEAIVVEDGDLVMTPRGYHPVGAAHGYNLYYLNVMAGPERRWVFRNDPAHAWLAGTR